MSRHSSTFNKIVITILLFTFVPELYAETSTVRKTIYNTFINREMSKWGNIIRTLETGKPLTTVDQKLELISYYYGYIGHLIGKKQNDQAEPMILKGEKLIQQVLQASPKNATAYAYKGSFLGFHIAINKYKSLRLSSESMTYIDKACELDPQNAQALIDKGNMLYYSPRLFGGDKEEAITFYLKGVKILEKNKDTDQNWVYLNLLTTIALAYDKINKPKEATLTCEKILRKEPNYKWVRDVIYPKLQRNKQSSRNN